MTANTPLPILIASGLWILLTLLFMATHAAGLYRFFTLKDDAPASKLAIAAWITSAVGGFMGPCVIVTNLAALVMGVMALRADPTPRTRLCAQTAILAGGIIVGMGVTMTAFAVWYSQGAA